MNWRKLLTRIGMGVCLGVFLLSAWELIHILMDYRSGDIVYEHIQSQIIVVKDQVNEQISIDTTSVGDEIKEKKKDFIMEVDMKKLKEINEDAVGWICIPDTNINYPIMAGDDNQFYLDRAIDGSKQVTGSIFLDYRNQIDFTDKNTIIYGHNMKNGSMFGQLKKYQDIEFYKKHPSIIVVTMDGQSVYDIVSVAHSNIYKGGYELDFLEKLSYERYLEKIMRQSLYSTGLQVTTEDKIITLSTCSGNDKDARFIIHGKKR